MPLGWWYSGPGTHQVPAADVTYFSFSDHVGVVSVPDQGIAITIHTSRSLHYKAMSPYVRHPSSVIRPKSAPSKISWAVSICPSSAIRPKKID